MDRRQVLELRVVRGWDCIQELPLERMNERDMDQSPPMAPVMNREPEWDALLSGCWARNCGEAGEM